MFIDSLKFQYIKRHYKSKMFSDCVMYGDHNDVDIMAFALKEKYRMNEAIAIAANMTVVDMDAWF